MPTAVVLVLLAVPVVAVLARLTQSALPLRRSAQLGAVEVTAVVVGVLGLVGHCTAMFFPSLARRLPGTTGAVEAINDLGGVSVAAYVVPALLLVLALRRAPAFAAVLLVAVLVAVGVTMYAGSPLAVHLAAIVAAAVTLASVLAAATTLSRDGAGPGTSRRSRAGAARAGRTARRQPG